MNICMNCNSQTKNKKFCSTECKELYTINLNRVEFLESFSKNNKQNFKLINNYKNSKTKITVQCLRCLQKTKNLPKATKNKLFCNSCDSYYYQLSFKDKLLQKFGKEFILLSNYINSSTKIKVKHEKCGKITHVRPHNLLSTGQCSVCNKGIKKTHEQYLKEIECLYIVALETYKNDRTPIKHQCQKCMTIESKTPQTVLSNKGGCSNCANNKAYNQDDYTNLLLKERKGEIKLLGSYKGMFTPALHAHHCGYEWEVSPNNIIHSKNTCPHCNGGIRDSEEDYVKKLMLKHKNIILLESYTRSADKLLHKHELCGHVWRVTPNSLLNGTGCPKCFNNSKGEEKIKLWLEKNKISYIPQYRNQTCKNINTLPFDFAIFKNSYKNNPAILCEYDGEQHFKSVSYFGGEQGFLKRKNNDQIKNQWAKDNNIPLLRIPYWEFDRIEEILKEELKEFL